MAERLLLLLVLALLLGSAGLWLLHLAARQRERARVDAHLERQLRADPAIAPEPAPWMRELADPFDAPPAAPADGTEGQGARTAVAALLPAWLQGAVNPRALLLGLLLAGGAIAVGAVLLGPVAALAAAALSVLLGAFALWLAVQRFRRTLVRQLPGFIDAMVRLITIGNSTQAAFQLGIASTEQPLRDHLDKVSSLVRAGAELDEAVQQMADTVRVEEMHLLAAILGLGVRYGGRADLLLERVAHFMRDREQAEQELTALSAETRLSAWVLGLLPIGVGLAIVMMNTAYFLRMWQDDTGRTLLYAAGALQLIGAGLLYRLARVA